MYVGRLSAQCGHGHDGNGPEIMWPIIAAAAAAAVAVPDPNAWCAAAGVKPTAAISGSRDGVIIISGPDVVGGCSGGIAYCISRSSGKLPLWPPALDPVSSVEEATTSFSSITGLPRAIDVDGDSGDSERSNFRLRLFLCTSGGDNSASDLRRQPSVSCEFRFRCVASFFRLAFVPDVISACSCSCLSWSCSRRISSSAYLCCSALISRPSIKPRRAASRREWWSIAAIPLALPCPPIAAPITLGRPMASVAALGFSTCDATSSRLSSSRVRVSSRM